MVKSVQPILSGFDDVSEQERELLFEMFRLWQESPSLSVVAEALFCHPNTVRYRLRRIEQRTRRSLARPRDVAELCLAIEVHRRLM
ncbi:MAG: helix-turn-helix domain-containing protein [Candidatus Acidiferrales bacterium]